MGRPPAVQGAAGRQLGVRWGAGLGSQHPWEEMRSPGPSPGLTPQTPLRPLQSVGLGRTDPHPAPALWGTRVLARAHGG